MGMKIVVISGTGLIGSKVVEKLTAHGHEAVPAAPNTGVNTLTGEGLAEVLKNSSVVVDVSNSPSFEDKAVMEFFRTSDGAGRTIYIVTPQVASFRRTRIDGHEEPDPYVVDIGPR